MNHSFRFVLSESKDSISESSVVFGAFAPKTHQYVRSERRNMSENRDEVETDGGREGGCKY